MLGSRAEPLPACAMRMGTKVWATAEACLTMLACRQGFLVYQTQVLADAARAGLVLDFGDPVHDAASVQP